MEHFDRLTWYSPLFTSHFVGSVVAGSAHLYPMGQSVEAAVALK
jgi:hypothetical protein